MTTTHLMTFVEVVEIARLVEHDYDELARSCDKGASCPQPSGPRRIENTNKTDMTKILRKTNSRPPCPKCGHFHARVFFREPDTCFKCGRVSHIGCDFPEWKRDQTTIPKQTK